MRFTILASLLAALALAACGQSQAEKASDQVCDARDDIGQQVEELQGLTLTTATTDELSESLKEIRSDLERITDATGDLSDERREDVEAANKAFTSKMTQIGQDLGSSLSIENAATQAKAALGQLADSYRTTFGQLECS